MDWVILNDVFTFSQSEFLCLWKWPKNFISGRRRVIESISVKLWVHRLLSVYKQTNIAFSSGQIT